jgi:hypothetical protein
MEPRYINLLINMSVEDIQLVAAGLGWTESIDYGLLHSYINVDEFAKWPNLPWLDEPRAVDPWTDDMMIEEKLKVLGNVYDRVRFHSVSQVLAAPILWPDHEVFAAEDLILINYKGLRGWMVDMMKDELNIDVRLDDIAHHLLLDEILNGWSRSSGGPRHPGYLDQPLDVSILLSRNDLTDEFVDRYYAAHKDLEALHDVYKGMNSATSQLKLSCVPMSKIQRVQMFITCQLSHKGVKKLLDDYSTAMLSESHDASSCYAYFLLQRVINDPDTLYLVTRDRHIHRREHYRSMMTALRDVVTNKEIKDGLERQLAIFELEPHEEWETTRRQMIHYESIDEVHRVEWVGMRMALSAGGCVVHDLMINELELTT